MLANLTLRLNSAYFVIELEAIYKTKLHKFRKVIEFLTLLVSFTNLNNLLVEAVKGISCSVEGKILFPI